MFLGCVPLLPQGEAIGFEVLAVCRAANPNLRVFRARFSALTQHDLSRALSTNLVKPNALENDAVLCRREVDMRTGYAFTRYLTKLIRASGLDVSAEGSGSADGTLVSYGPCQFPTLGFIVRRFWEARTGFFPGKKKKRSSTARIAARCCAH